MAVSDQRTEPKRETNCIYCVCVCVCAHTQTRAHARTRIRTLAFSCATDFRDQIHKVKHSGFGIFVSPSAIAPAGVYNVRAKNVNTRKRWRASKDFRNYIFRYTKRVKSFKYFADRPCLGELDNVFPIRTRYRGSVRPFGPLK